MSRAFVRESDGEAEERVPFQGGEALIVSIEP